MSTTDTDTSSDGGSSNDGGARSAATPDDAATPSGVEIRFGQDGRVLTVPDAWINHWHGAVRAVVREPFGRRAWRELAYFMVSGVLAGRLEPSGLGW